MRHHVHLLLLVVVFGALAVMAASGEDAAVPPVPDFHMDFPPLPSPADMVPPPCLNSLTPVCVGVTDKDSPNVAPCCAAFKKLFKNDPTCVCDAVARAQKIAKDYKLNGTMYDGLGNFRLCDMPTTSCEPGQPGSENLGNAAPSGRSIGAFQIMFLPLPLFFMMLL